MAKIALLIGISEYGEGLSSLPGTQEDIATLQRVLQSPKIGGFDTVDVLPNPDRTEMESAIETLFTENRNQDDLVLLYFSGHGFRDNNGTLYFANRITAKTAQGRIRTSTAIPATTLQYYMNHSRLTRQIVILDCCFSGAFANDMKAKTADEAIDVKAQLGGEGRVVLTSSTATQVSYEREGASIYTRYLVQGLETGAADQDEDGQISVDELHEYAREKVQETAPTMQPEIYTVREGYKILIARAPQGDPKLVFRKELDARAKEKQGKFSPTDRRAFRFRWQELDLSDPQGEQIISEILQPYQEFWAKLDEFEQAVKETLDNNPQLSAGSLDDLRYFQRTLKLRDADILPVLNIYNLNLNPVPEVNSGQTGLDKGSVVSPTAAKPAPPPAGDDLSSEKGIDYTPLRDLLKAQKWKEADRETYKVMIWAVGKESTEFSSEELLNFPCAELKTIDQLWVKYSKGCFGFSVQKKIYVECGAQLDGNYPGEEIWQKFGYRVGWGKDDKWFAYATLNPSFSSPQGNFPVAVTFGTWSVINALSLFFFCGGLAGSLLSHRDL